MYPNPIPLQVNGAGTVFNYDLKGTSESASVYGDNAAALNAPHTLSVKHQSTNVGKTSQTRRTVVRIDHQLYVALTGETVTISAYVVLVVPIGASGTDVAAPLGQLADFLQEAGFQSKVINQEI